MAHEIPEWTDCLGQTYKPGDAVAYASISGKSPQLVIGEVVSIHSHDSKGNRYRNFKGQDICSVKVQPLLDARGFWRDYNAKAVHLKIVENIIKIPNELKPKPREEREREENTAGILSILEDLRT